MRRGLVPTKMAAKLQTLAKLLVFMLHIYRLTFLELLTAVQTTDPPLEFRISASLIDISEYRANCLVELCHDRPAMFTQISRVTSSSSVHSKPGLESLSLLILCGDILLNSGPRWQHPCGMCQKPVKKKPERPPVWFLWFVVPYKMLPCQRRHLQRTRQQFVFLEYEKKLQIGRMTDTMSIYLSWTSPKPFDTVPHQRLLSKLESYGIYGNLGNWLRHWLTARTQNCHAG